MKFDLNAYLTELEYLVNIDSGSKCLEGVAKVGEYFAEKFTAMDWSVKRHNLDSAIAPCFEISNTDKECFDILLAGHIDTVFPIGTVSERPFTTKDGMAYGPGIVDMKSCLLSAYYVLKKLQAENKLQDISVCLALNSEEEIGSKRARPWLERLASKSRFVFVLEPARANGDLVLMRKGLGRYNIEFHGVAAHAGVDPQNGVSAIGELGHWITTLQGLTDIPAGLTVNVGTVLGGTTANVVADYAKAEVDFRFVAGKQIEKIENEVSSLLAHAETSKVKVNVIGGVNRPPMIPMEKTEKLCRLTEVIGSSIGIDIKWAQTGGGSDGNFSAALGVPTIDGLGPIGGGTHSVNEYLIIDSIEQRMRLLSELIVKAPELE